VTAVASQPLNQHQSASRYAPQQQRRDNRAVVISNVGEENTSKGAATNFPHLALVNLLSWADPEHEKRGSRMSRVWRTEAPKKL